MPDNTMMLGAGGAGMAPTLEGTERGLTVSSVMKEIAVLKDKFKSDDEDHCACVCVHGTASCVVVVVCVLGVERLGGVGLFGRSIDGSLCQSMATARPGVLLYAVCVCMYVYWTPINRSRPERALVFSFPVLPCPPSSPTHTHARHPTTATLSSLPLHRHLHPHTHTPVSPYQDLEKAAVLQECRVFHDANVVTQDPRRCCQLITKLLHILAQVRGWMGGREGAGGVAWGGWMDGWMDGLMDGSGTPPAPIQSHTNPLHPTSP